jgi:hypothetical protein
MGLQPQAAPDRAELRLVAIPEGTDDFGIARGPAQREDLQRGIGDAVFDLAAIALRE